MQCKAMPPQQPHGVNACIHGSWQPAAADIVHTHRLCLATHTARRTLSHEPWPTRDCCIHTH